MERERNHETWRVLMTHLGRGASCSRRYTTQTTTHTRTHATQRSTRACTRHVQTSTHALHAIMNNKLLHTSGSDRPHRCSRTHIRPHAPLNLQVSPYTSQWAMSPASFRWGIPPPHLIPVGLHGSLGSLHRSLQPKRHLDRFSRFCKGATV